METYRTDCAKLINKELKKSLALQTLIKMFSLFLMVMIQWLGKEELLSPAGRNKELLWQEHLLQIRKLLLQMNLYQRLTFPSRRR